MSAHDTVPKFAKGLGVFGVIMTILAVFYQVPIWESINNTTTTYSNENNFVATTTESSFSPNATGTFYKVERVIDGDTFSVNIRGVNERVRLLGINTPETVDPNRPVQCYGKESSERMKELVLGKLVQLKYDYTQGTRDVYNRLLVYVYLEDGQMVNRKLVAEGYAYEYTYMSPYIYQSEFRQLQNIAHTSGRGLWSKDTCNGSKEFSQ